MKEPIKLFRITISIALLFTLSLWSCDKDDDPPVGTEGNVSGAVNLYDDGVNPLSNDSMVVSILGSNPLISDTTDSQGRFDFKDLAYGTYFLTFTKPGYGFTMINNVYHHSENTALSQKPSFGQFSTTEVTSLSTKDTLGSIYIYSSTIPIGNIQNPRYIRVFFHHSDAVNFLNFENYSQVIKVEGNPAEYRLNPHALEDMGFNPGETVWIKVYGESYYSNAYIEPVKGQHVFPNLNMHSAAATSFVVP